jgi:hypothetical protein
MYDTMRSNTLRFLVFLMTVTLAISGLPLSLSGKAYTTNNAGSHWPAPGTTATPALTPTVVPALSSPTYNLLLQDDSSGDMLRWNTSTGDYVFSRCSNGFSLSGTGTATAHGSTYSLTHNPGDRRITATLDDGAHKGSASVQYPLSTTYTITDRNTTNDPGLSDSTPPQVGLTGPNGGEIIDTLSSFTITWSASDAIGVVSQDLLFSTDGGTTFSPIVTGLAGSLNQYVWSVPLMINKQTVKVRVVARDAACNASFDDSKANFTIWNPPASFTHSAEAPLFMTGQGLTSTIYMTNTSASSIVVELDPHQPSGNATQNFPYQVLLNAGASTTVDTASLYMIGANPENPAFPDLIQGGIRLRHTGSQDRDVRALIAAERDCNEQFTTPFTYATSSLSALGTMQCSAMYYVDADTAAYVSFQNATDLAQTVQLTCNYGTGAAGTPNGVFKNQPFVLGPQQTRIINLGSVWSAFGGADWGSMDVFTSAPRSVICHSVMMSRTKGIAWDCPFVDPAMAKGTTKVAQTVKLDYNNSENAYLMVCNMSATNSRTVTASFNTSNGVTISPVQVTVAPGAQQMITLNAQQLLKPGSSTMADVRLTYAGSASDILAAGCSMTTSEDRAMAVKFREAVPADGRRLSSPYFRFDEDVSGQVLISNLGSASIKVGARMVFANSTATPLKTPLVTIPAGGVATIDLKSVGDAVPDNVVASGRIDLIHNGVDGTVTAAVTESGCYNSAQVVPLDGGVPLDPLALFPIAAVVIPGACTELDAITDGTVINPTFSNPGGCYGQLIGTFQTGPYTFQATLCVPTNCFGDMHIVYTPSGDGAGDSSDLVVVQSNFADFTTSLGTRLHPGGTTSFTLTAQNPFPNALLEVDFVGKGATVLTQAHGDGVHNSISGTGPTNHSYLRAVKKIIVTQLNPDGTPNTAAARVLKTTNSGAYYALDKPTNITAVTPNNVAVTGGTVTITGSGFQTWQLGSGFNTVTVNPIVLIGKANGHDQIPFTVVSVAQNFTSITGNVGPTPNTIATCPEIGETPCKTITVINPGGSDGVDDLTSQKLLTINAPPPPVIDGTAALTITGASGPAASNSIAMQNIRLVGGYTAASPVSARISGRNLGRVRTVTFVGTAPVLLGPSNINSAGTRIEVGVPVFCVTGGGGANAVAVIVDDGVNPVVSFANGWVYTATGPIQLFLPNVPLNAVAFLAGTCEDVAVTYSLYPDGGAAIDCSFQVESCVEITSVSVLQHGLESIVFPNVNIALFRWGASCPACTGPGTTHAAFPATGTNVRSGIQASVCAPASCSH